EANASAIVARAAADRIVEDARAETARAQSDAATARAEAAAAQSDAASAQSDAANARAEALAAQSDAATARAEAAAAQSDAASAQSDAANARAEALAAQSDAANARAEALEAQSDAAGARAEVAARQRDLELLRYEKGQLQEIAREFDRVVHSRSWRLTRPLRGVARLLRGELRASLKPLHSPQATPAMPAIPAMQEVAVTVDAAPPAPPAAAFPAPVRLSAPAAEQGELPDVFIWSVIDWYFRFQRPQHLAEALAAKGHRVFYVSNNFDNDATPGFRCEQIDGAGRLFQVNLNLAGSPSIYAAMPSADQVACLRRSLAEVLQWAGTSSAISLVQHPFWKALARSVPDARVVYDCMDHHGGFADNKVDVLAAEEALVRDADLVVVSSGWLRD